MENHHTTIGNRFELRELIAADRPTAEVWRAYDLIEECEVVVKWSRLEYQQPFGREVAAFELLRNTPSSLVVRGIASGEWQGRLYLAMEYCRGGTLADKLQRERLSEQAAVRILLDVAHAVKCLHEKGIVHRDLKPSNILFDSENVPKVADLGCAKLESAENAFSREERLLANTLTEAGQMVGTIAYMSPEQTGEKNARKKLSTATDIWTLGVILYEMQAGQSPFMIGNRHNHFNVVDAIRKVDFPRLTVQVPGINPALEILCENCLRRSPENRYSLEKLIEDLQAFLMGDSLSIHPLPNQETCEILATTIPFASRKKMAFARIRPGILGVVFITLICGIFLMKGWIQAAFLDPKKIPIKAGAGEHNQKRPLNQNGRSEPSDIPPPFPDEIHSWDLKPLVPSASINTISASPDGKTIAYGTLAGDLRILEMHTLKTLSVAIAGTEGISFLAWHPSGNSLATFSRRGTVQVWSNTLKPRQELAKLELQPDFFGFNADGTRLLAAGNAQGWLWNVENKGEELEFSNQKEFSADKFGNREGTWSPNPNTGRFVTAGAERVASIWSADGERLQNVLELEDPEALKFVCVDWHPQDRWIVLGVASKIDPAFSEIRFVSPEGVPGPVVTSHQHPLHSLAWSPDGNVLASLDASGKLIITSVAGEHLGEFFPDAYGELRWSSDGNRMITRCKTGGISILNFQKNSQGKIRILDGLKLKIDQSAGEHPVIARPGHGFSWMLSGNRVQLIDPIAHGWESHQIRLPESADQSAWSPDGKWIAVRITKPTHKVQLINVDGSLGPELLGHTQSIREIHWESNTQRLATVSWDGTVKIWVINGHLFRSYPVAPQGSPHSFSWHPRGHSFAIACEKDEKDTLQIWMLDAEEPIEIQPNPPHIYHTSWSPDGEHVIAAGPYKYLQVWSADGTPGARLEKYKGRVWETLWNYDKTKFLAWDETIAQVWEFPDRLFPPPLTLPGDFREAAWSPTQNTVAFGGVDGSVLLWDVGAENPRKLAGHKSRVIGLAWSGDGKQLVTTCNDRVSHVWDSTTGERQATFLDCREGRFRMLDGSGRVMFGTEKHEQDDVVNTEFQILVNDSHSATFHRFRQVISEREME